ncbi:MAG TPA: hypothetical protein VGF28_04440 [Thermoanaerobaculia bacterium]|jgi:xanthine dehydrogenase iron-sulfur cluster and FAD-binding subunit A
MTRLVLLLLAFAVAGPLGATAQRPDVLKLNGKTYDLATNPLRPVLALLGDRFPKLKPVSSSLWRGYIGHWSVRGGKLFLDDVKVPTSSYADLDAPESKKFRSIMKRLFDDAAPRVATWYTGNLIVPTGELVDYVHLGYGSTYSSYVVVTVVKGAVTQQRAMNGEQFMQFRRAQYAAYKKTAEHAKERAKLKTGTHPLTDARADDFLFQAAAEEYLSRIFE